MLTSIRRVVLLCAVLGSLVSLSAQTLPGSYAPVPAPQFLTDAGAPCAGCDLYTYASGTTTPLATYTDVGLTTPNANPIVLDSAGRATIFLSNTTYKFVLKTSGGVTIWTRDTIASIAQMAASVISTTLQVVQSNSSTGTLNDFALTANAGTLKMSNASLATITGLSAGYDGQELVIVSTGAGQVDISNQAAGSAAANRVINPITGTISLAAGTGKATLQYDTTAARWRVIYHEQGAAIAWTPAFKGSTSQSGQVYTTQTGFYTLRGNRVFIDGTVVLSTLGTITGNVEIGELPFAVSGSIASTGGLSNWSSFTTSYVYLTGITITSSTRFRLQGLTAAATGVSNLAQANLSATTNVTFSANYLTP